MRSNSKTSTHKLTVELKNIIFTILDLYKIEFLTIPPITASDTSGSLMLIGELDQDQIKYTHYTEMLIYLSIKSNKDLKRRSLYLH